MKKIALLVVLVASFIWQPQAIANSGGPDAYGYVWADSDEPGGPTYAWVDITGRTGTVDVTGLSDDNAAPSMVPLGFDFQYYWSQYNEVKVGSNGWLSFDDVSNVAHCFPTIPTAGGNGDNLLAPFMSDLIFTGAGNPGEVKYWTNQSDSLVISYLNVPFWLGSAPGYTGSSTFQVILNAADSSIVFQYGSVTAVADQGGCARDIVVGIENITGNIGLETHADVTPASNYAIRFTAPATPLISIPDITPAWNDNANNRGQIILEGDAYSPTTNIANVGNVDVSSNFMLNTTISNSVPAPVFSDSVSFSSLSVGADTLAQLGSWTPSAPGLYSVFANTSFNQDINPSNNANESELMVMSNCDATATLSYVSGALPDGTISWTGADGDDGIAVYYEPPVYPFTISSLDFFIFNTQFTSGFTAIISDDDGLPGLAGTTLFIDSVSAGAVVNVAWNTVNVNPGVTITSGGFYVQWIAAGVDISLGTSSDGAPSHNNFEILNGGWADYRNNSTSDAMIRANIGSHPNDGLTASFGTSTNDLTVDFTDATSGSVDSWSWDFGDGNTSTQENPSHSYSAYGTYTACLIVTNGCGSDTTCSSVTVTPHCGDLFISEYIEGSSSNKALELYNPTTAAIDLTEYVMYRANNGSLTPTDSLFMQGMIAADDVFVIGNPSANASIMAQADTTHSLTFYNGDDCVWLQHIASGQVVDRVGELGVDPGSGWSVGTGATNNFTLIRKLPIDQGSADWTTGQTEWDVYPIDMTDSLGAHNLATPSWALEAAFSNVETGFTVTFTDESTGADSWYWDFGDGNTSAQPSPSHVYANYGIYTVCLIVTNDCFSDTVCTSIFLQPYCGDLFISEYIEGSSSNKALELYNPTTAAIDLTEYVMYRANNGSLTPTDSLFIQGMLAADDVFVIANPSANASIMTQSDTTHSLTFYNGDDCVWLQHIASGQVVDRVGQLGVDPGSGWSVGTGATNNFTLIRKLPIDQGSTDWATGQNEWDVYPIDMTDSLGFHHIGGMSWMSEAAFSSVGSNLSVAFTDLSTAGPTSWLWDFGDGNTSTQQNPTHSYATTGTYTVCLTVSNGCNTDSSCSSVVVTCPVPVADWSYSANGATISYTDLSTNLPTTWFWDFGDGNTSSMQNPTHTYAATGVYTACLTVVSECGADSSCAWVNVCVAETPTITGFSNLSHHGTTVNWSGASVPAGGKYVIRYHIFGDSPNFGYKVITNESATSGYVNGLNPNTRYVFRVGAKCATQTSASFSDTSSVWTRNICPQPTGMGSSTAPFNATLSWDDMGADTYKVKFRKVGGTWGHRNTTSTSVTITDLDASSQYEWKVRSLCDAGGNRPYGALQQFSTPSERLASQANSMVGIHPNPTSGLVNLNLGKNDEAVIVVRNIHGQLIYRESVQNIRNHQIHLDGASGLYTIEVMTIDGQNEVFRILKE